MNNKQIEDLVDLMFDTDMEEVMKENKQLTEKIDKAIEYIKTQVHRNQQFYEMDKDNLLEILGDKEK